MADRNREDEIKRLLGSTREVFACWPRQSGGFWTVIVVRSNHLTSRDFRSVKTPADPRVAHIVLRPGTVVVGLGRIVTYQIRADH